MMAFLPILTVIFLTCMGYIDRVGSQDIIGCGGFVKSEVEINFSLIEVKLYTSLGSLKYSTDCAPNSGYYMVPVYDRGDYVLKVEPPPGWTFEPQSVALHIDGETDACSLARDIDFTFTGFGVVGKVVSKGSDVGPTGVTLTLRKRDSKAAVQQTLSEAGGAYSFDKVLPGEYTVDATHTTWVFETASSVVTVGRETGNAGSALTVLGYNVKGHVFSEGDPIRGVHFLLFSDTVKAQDVRGCNHGDVKGFPASGNTPLCYTTSKEDGQFTFSALPTGAYSLVPFYQGEHIMFDVVPAQLQFTVRHESLALPEDFQVAGFSVSGRVIRSKQGSGVGGAQVYLNSKLQTTTRADGSYHLDSMKAGTYRLMVTSDGLFFDMTPVRINPNTPQLPDIVAARFSACGSVVIDQVPEGLQISPTRRVNIHTSPGATVTVETTAEGAFCAELAPGKYTFKVVLSAAELAAGLKLAPVERDVDIVDSAVNGIKFSQFRAKVTGKVSCLESCGSQQVALESANRGDDRMFTYAQSDTHDATFTFHNIMPGKYRVRLLNDVWCWKEKELDIEVSDRDVGDMVFTQSGYILSCSLSHDITLNFAQEEKEGSVGSFNLTKGVNKFCLARPGVYRLTPVSCHKFEQEMYRYDTSQPAVLTLHAVKHTLEGAITTKDMHYDIVLTIRSKSAGVEDVTLGPLKLDAPPSTKKSKGKNSPPAGPHTYRFTHLARKAEHLTVVPSSGELLFYPSNIEVTMLGETCPGQHVQFEARLGVFISGLTQPTLTGVEITVTQRDAPTATPIHVTTNSKGAYRVGPLHGDLHYDVTAIKEGYVFTAVEGKQGHFKAFKLGEVAVQVLDESKQPLSGVLLSLAGSTTTGTSYRSNNITQDNGMWTFLSLQPGTYYLKPILKEYKFDPQSQMIEVTEGTSKAIEVRGSRVAFSCYGVVQSLSGEAEQSIYVEAVGAPDCGAPQEESKTEQDGSFRIRGLQPHCQYEVRVKIGEHNPRIERAAPRSHAVIATTGDVRDVRIIAFRRVDQQDLGGNIVTATEFLSSLKVHLYREDDPDSPIHTIALGSTPFFYLPSVKLDSKNYLVRLDSSLVRTMYEFSLPETTFTANTTYQHFTFKFNPQRRGVEQELSPSSLLVLPLTLLVIALAYNHTKVTPVLLQTATNVMQSVMRQRAGTPPPSAATTYTIHPELLDDLSAMSKRKAKLRKT